MDAVTACAALREAAHLNREDPNRRGALLTFEATGQLVMTGDLHGNVRNFEKLQRYCALGCSFGRCVILHELIHEEPDPPGSPDYSVDLLLRAAAWKCQHPDNVFVLQSNHELSQLCGHEISKGGRYMLADFRRGVEERFAAAAGDVLDAIDEYIASLPLAARTENGIFLAHSLPDAQITDTFDLSVFDREPTPADMAPGGAAYALVWGRYHTAEVVERFAQRLGVELCVVGHMPQDYGHVRVGRLVILASEHAHGVFVPIDLRRKYTPAELEASIRKFVSVQ